MASTSNQPTITHLLALGSLRNWLRLLRENGGVDRPFWGRAAFITAVSTLTAPLRWYERGRYNRAIARTPLQDPVFILGHWRSGTTNLHYLLSQDQQFGFVTMFQMVAPELLFVGEKVLKPAFARVTPSKRPIDNLPLSIDGAQEEEFGLATMSPHALYHCWFFPRSLERYLTTYALFENVAPRVIREWKSAYQWMLRKAVLNSGGKRLLIKNPSNTARIRQLLELFPDARFVHIYRDPYRVFLSMRYMMTINYAALQLQTISSEQIEANVLRIYEAVMRQYLRDRELIPAERLVEIRFEDLERDPLGELRRVYDRLDLPGFDAATPAFQAYIDSLRGYQKNALQLGNADIDKVNRHWGFAFDALGYQRMIPGQIAQPETEQALAAGST
jgi:omega-hydroxy-beta-dihydromenaquinone-9 sulfotransferase